VISSCLAGHCICRYVHLTDLCGHGRSKDNAGAPDISRSQQIDAEGVSWPGSVTTERRSVGLILWQSGRSLYRLHNCVSAWEGEAKLTKLRRISPRSQRCVFPQTSEALPR
jgi:hypothetical protein